MGEVVGDLPFFGICLTSLRGMELKGSESGLLSDS